MPPPPSTSGATDEGFDRESCGERSEFAKSQQHGMRMRYFEAS